MANPVGRPPKFASVEELQAKIDDYFHSRVVINHDGEERSLPITITGLCLHLDTSRETLCEYENKPEFTDAIKKAKMRVENFAEEMLHVGKNQTGAIFALKNFGWTDKTTIAGDADAPVKHDHSVEVAFVQNPHRDS